MSAPRKGRPTAAPADMVIDRIEADLAVVELPGGEMLDLPLWMLPEAAKEGDVIRVKVSGSGAASRMELAVDAAETARRKAAVNESLARLRQRDPGGDIVL